MPWVPFLPAIGIFFNFMLCTGLDGLTWAYFGVFVAIGIIIYFSYGLWHSNLEIEMITRGEMEMSINDTYDDNYLDADRSIDNIAQKYIAPKI